MSVTAQGLAALREKYVEIRALRREHDAGLGDDPRARMRALATRFPGALRELDRLPMHELDRRIDELTRLSREDVEAAAVPPWAMWLVRYHVRVRELLRARQHELGARPKPDEPVRRVRLNDAVIAELAQEACVSPSELERILFAFDRGHARRGSAAV